MDDFPILWVVAVLVALIGCGTAGCSSQPARLSNAPIPSPSDTNLFPSGTIATDARDMSGLPTDHPAANSSGGTGSLRTPR